MAERRSTTCVEWFEAWLTSIATLGSPRSSGWEENLAYYARHQNASSQNEVAIELYHAMHRSDLSLKELAQHIDQIGNVLYQVDLKQLASQPKSRHRQMLTAFFDTPDISQAVAECHREHSFAYVYLLVRLLYEVLLYTKSSAVRSFCFYQVLRNAHVLRVLFGLVTREVTIRETEGHTEGREELQGGWKSSYSVDAMDTVGQLPRHFSFNVMDNILRQMLTAPDMNLRVCGLELVRLCPRIVACNPQLLSELKDALVGPVDECASKAAIALVDVLEYAPESVAQAVLRSSHDHALKMDFSPQRVQSFCCVALGCRTQRCCKLAFRMCWNVWLHIDQMRGPGQASETLIVRESQFYLLLTGTLLCAERPELGARQKRRLESLMYDQKDRDASMEVAFCLNLLYRKDAEIRDLNRLMKMEIKGAGVKQDLHVTLVRVHLGQFAKSRHSTAFLSAIAVFEILVRADPANVKLVEEIKEAFKLLRTSYTDHMLRILRAMSRQYAALGGELEYLRSVVLRVLGSMIRMCYLFETQKFAKHVPDMKEIVRNSDLRFLIKPLLSALDFELVDDRITATQVNLWVGTLYDLCNTKPPKIHNYLTTPVTLDLLTGLLSWETDAAPMRVTVITKKDTFNSLVINEHVRGLVGSACDKVSSGAALRQVVHLALRLGLYAEAARCLKQLELWTNNTLLWFDGLYHHALAESETDVLKAVQHRVQSLDALDAYGHQCTVWMLQKASNDVLAPNLNYALPGLVAHAWCALLMLFQVAVGHLYKVVQGGEEGLRELRPLFVGLFAHFKVLRWCFRGLCSETSVILHIYEGLCLVLYALCSTPMQPAESEGPAARGLKSDVISDPNESLRRYALRVFGEEDLHLPDTFAMVDLLDPGVKRRLYCAPAILAAHRTLLGATAKPSGDSATPGIVRAMPVGMPATAAELSIESLLKEFVLFTRVRTNKDKIYTKRAQAWMLDYAGAANQSELSFTFMSRDFDSLNALLLPAKTCDVRKRKPTALLALVQRMTSLQLPTPAGVLKTFPLPFAALTALVEHEKRSGEGPAAIHIQGSIRNSARQVEWVKIRLEVVEGAGRSAVVFRRRFRLRHNAIDKYVHVYLQMQQIEALSFSCLPLDSEGRPCGVPTHFRPSARELPV